ncbi:hypothetical protein BGX27_003406 [Mortierella sp. AM989]|nr:hypothetical protein BGX27_003406 [Mortierella sp. AM989]
MSPYFTLNTPPFTLSNPLSHQSKPLSKLATSSFARCLRRQLSCTLSILLLFSPVSGAVSCLYPTIDTVVQPGEVVPVTWQLSEFDSFLYDTLLAELSCVDSLGSLVTPPNPYLFEKVGQLQTFDSSEFVFPNCGPATNGSIKIMASLYGYAMSQYDECHVSILQASRRIPEPFEPLPLLPTTTAEQTSITETKTVPKVGPPASTSSAPKPISIVPDPNRKVPSPNVPSSNVPSSTNRPNTSGAAIPSNSADNAGGVQLISPTGNHSPSASPSASLLPPVSGSSGSNLPTGAGDTNEEHGSTKSIVAILGSIGVVVCLALVVMPLVIRHRRKKAALAGKNRTVLPRSMEPGANAMGGGAGGVMKEAKGRLRLKRRPKEGYFYQMDDQDDEVYSDVHSGKLNESVPGLATSSHATGDATAIATLGTNDKEDILERTAYSSFDMPQQACIDLSAVSHMQRSSSQLTNTPFRNYSPSSLRTSSSIEESSVIRKYWEASMAARAEINDTQTQTDISGETYDEGSIFGDGSSRDSESRMADILSLRTADSGSVVNTIGTLENRRSTLNSMGDISSFGHDRSLTTTLSSIPDSLMISEEEFLQRLQMHEMQMQLEQEYYDRYYSDHREPYPARSTISRMSSVPSLTSTNDPFQTFDSNELLLDANPFSDSRAVSRASERSDREL